MLILRQKAYKSQEILKNGKKCGFFSLVCDRIYSISEIAWLQKQLAPANVIELSFSKCQYHQIWLENKLQYIAFSFCEILVGNPKSYLRPYYEKFGNWGLPWMTMWRSLSPEAPRRCPTIAVLVLKLSFELLFLCIRNRMEKLDNFVLSVCGKTYINLRYLGHTFWTVRERNLIYSMHTQVMKPLQMTLRSMTLITTFCLR